jgi:hypothetical protein
VQGVVKAHASARGTAKAISASSADFERGRQQVAPTLKNELGQMPGHEKLLISYIFEKMEINDDDMVELRGFEPVISAMRHPRA